MKNYFKVVQAFRHAVHELPKDMSEAFHIIEYKQSTKHFVLAEHSLVQDENVIKHKMVFLEIHEDAVQFYSPEQENQIELPEVQPQNAITFCVIMNDAQYAEYERYYADGPVIRTKQYLAVLCKPMQTIGRILEQDLAPIKTVFVDDTLCGVQIKEYAYEDIDVYTKRLAVSMSSLKTKFKTV